MLKREYKQDHSLDSKTDHDRDDDSFRKLINEFYEDSDDENAVTNYKAKPPAIIKDFKPFEIEKLLVMADLLPQQTEQNRQNILISTSGFATCTNFNKSNLKMEFCGTTVEENIESSPFIITESELISCCHQAEKILESDIPKNNENLTQHEQGSNNDNNMVLVNSILQDFSQSPLGEGQIVQHASFEYTPEFRMRFRPLKTYSRKFSNTARANLNQRFEEQATRDSSEYDEDHSSYSSLSIQEDVTLSENFNNQSAVSHTSHTNMLCENLLNLTEYYSQNQLHQSLSDEQQIQESNDICLLSDSPESVSNLHKISDIMNDIHTFRSKYPNDIRNGSYNSFEDFLGFLGNEYAFDAVNDEQESMNTSLQKTHDLVEKDNSRLDSWNEDDSHDIFACINTENILHHHNNRTPNNVESAMNKSANKKENFRLAEISLENPFRSNCKGFKTASSKPIQVSREAHIIAAKILSKLPDIPVAERSKIKKDDANIFENPEDYEWNDDCDLFVNFQTPILSKENVQNKLGQETLTDPQQEQYIPSTNLGFETAGGENVNTSCTALNISKEIADYNYEEDLSGTKLKVYAKTHNLKIEPPLLSDIKEVNMTDPKGTNNLISEVCMVSEQSCEEDLEKYKYIESKKIQTNCNENADTLKTSQEVTETVRLQFSSNSKFDINRGFQTANGKIIKTSIEARRRAQRLLEECTNNSEDYLNDLKSIHNDVNKISDKHRATDKCTHTYKTDTNEIKEADEKGSLSKLNVGFQTANGRQVFISAKAKQTAAKLLHEFDNILDNENYENDIKEIKMKIQNKNKDLKSESVQVDNSKTINCKRKHSIDNSDLKSSYKSPPAKSFKNDLHTPTLSFAGQSLKSPLTSAGHHSSVLRKNLLSLTKRRKGKRNSLTLTTEDIPTINKEIQDLNANKETPTKSCISLKAANKTPATPNIREFFSNAPLASTPRTNKPSKSLQIEDVDLKPIAWDNNDSITYKSTSNSIYSTSNISLNSTNPTAKERIGRLTMYGKAADVSPILIKTNRDCRASGLRRTRSMTKKTEK